MVRVPIKITFVGFKSHRVHTGTNFFLHKNWLPLISGKRESVNYSSSRAVGMLNPIVGQKMKARAGARRGDTCDHGLSRRRPLRVKPPTS